MNKRICGIAYSEYSLVTTINPGFSGVTKGSIRPMKTYPPIGENIETVGVQEGGNKNWTML